MNDQGLSAPFTMIRDITMQKEADAHIHFMAFHDALTGLPNRRMFEHQLSLLIENGAINKAAVLYIDLDRFKWVNDTFGHEMGDVLLKQAAARIQARAGADDLAARQGGDEFVLLLGSIAHLDGVTGTAAALLADLSAPFFLGGHEVQISCSIGIALYPDDGATKDELMKNADAALYRVKQSGRNGYSFFVSGL
jgi:diguanylate cyclase (GGDEF)-like protein